MRDLRVVFADLLPRGALRALASVGVCKAEAAPPFNPFYWGHDIKANPRNSFWISRTLGPQPAANDTWLEVTHCAQQAYRSGGSSFPFWAYEAPGSGISMNVGSTMVADSYNHATALLRQAFPKREGAAMADGEVSAALANSPLAGLDSLQVINHREYHSVEARHEIIFLGLRESDDVLGAAARAPGVLKCGRHPALFECTAREAARMANCSSRPSTSSDASSWLHTKANLLKVVSAHRRCNASYAAAPTHCYTEHVERWGEYYCCGTLPASAWRSSRLAIA